MSKDEQRLRAILAKIYERCSEEVRISPAWLATQAMNELDEDKRSPTLVYLAAHLQLRQIARSICRRRFEDDDSEAHELFPDLQKRYPIARPPGDDPEYVLLEHLTEEDVFFNVNRLRAEAAGKLRGADALEAWWHSRAA